MKMNKTKRRTKYKAQKKRTTKKPSRKALVKKLDALVSQIVRTRDGACVQCGSTEHLTCGHLFSRVRYSQRWSLDNCFCQCRGCNLKHEHDPWQFFAWHIEHFGLNSLQQLRKKWEQSTKYSDGELQELFDKMKGGEQ